MCCCDLANLDLGIATPEAEEERIAFDRELPCIVNLRFMQDAQKNARLVSFAWKQIEWQHSFPHATPILPKHQHDATGTSC